MVPRLVHLILAQLISHVCSFQFFLAFTAFIGAWYVLGKVGAILVLYCSSRMDSGRLQKQKRRKEGVKIRRVVKAKSPVSRDTGQVSPGTSLCPRSSPAFVLSVAGDSDLNCEQRTRAADSRP